MPNKNFGATCLLICLLLLNGILLAKFTYGYFLKARQGFFNTTSKAELFGETKNSREKIQTNGRSRHIKVFDANGLTRLKRSIEPSQKIIQNKTENVSNFFMSENIKPTLNYKNYFTWNLNLNVSKYGNSFFPQKTKSTGHAQTDPQKGKNYLNMSLRMESGGPRNYETLDNVWSSVRNFIRQLFKHESSSNGPNDFDKNTQGKILDPKTSVVNGNPLSQSKDEILSSVSTLANSSELLKIPNMIDEERDSLTTMSQERKDKESDSKQNEGNFLLGLFGLGRPRSTESPETGIGSENLRSVTDVRDFDNTSLVDFSDVGRVEGDKEPFPELLSLTNTLMPDIVEMPLTKDKILTPSLMSNSDAFQSLPNTTSSSQENTNSHISFMGQEIIRDEMCSDCEPSDKTTVRSVSQSKITIMREVAVSNSKGETQNESIVPEVALEKSEQNISTFGIVNKAVKNTDVIHESSTESDLNIKLHHMTELESELLVSKKDEPCTDCATHSFDHMIVDNDIEGETSKINLKINTNSSIAAQNNEMLVQKMSNINSPCFMCVSENVSLPSEMEKLNAVNISMINFNEPNSTADIMREVLKATEIVPNPQTSNLLVEANEDNSILETNKDPHQVEKIPEVLTKLFNSDDKTNHFFGASIMNNIGIGSVERSTYAHEISSNTTEFKDINEESKLSSTETIIKKKDEIILNSFEIENGVGRELEDNSEIDSVHTLVSSDGRELVQKNEIETENKVHESKTESISTSDCEGNCSKYSDSIQARTFPSDFETESKHLKNDIAFSLKSINSECLEDCNSEKLFEIKVNESSPNFDQNAPDTLGKTLVTFGSNQANSDCENDSNSLIREEKDDLNLNHFNLSELSIEDIDERNFHEAYELSPSVSNTPEIKVSTPDGELESMITKSKFIDEFGNKVDSFSDFNRSKARIQETFSPDPQFLGRGERLGDPYDPSHILERKPKSLSLEDELKSSTSTTSEAGFWIDSLPKIDFSGKYLFQTEMPETVTEHVQALEFQTRTEVNIQPRVRKNEFFNIRNSSMKPNHRTCTSASECNIFLNERCITSNKISICDCGRSFLRNEKTEMCEAKILVETSVRLPEEVYSDDLKDITTERYKKMKEDSTQMMWYLLAENPELARMVADIDVIGFNQGSLVVHWTITLHPTANNSQKEIQKNIETHLHDTLKNETVVRSAPLDLQSAALISRSFMDPCKIRDRTYCSENAICKLTNLDIGYTCECKTNTVDKSVNQNFPGEICEEKCPDSYCGLHGICQWQNNGRICVCSGWYLGEKCDLSAALVIAIFVIVNFVLLPLIVAIMFLIRTTRNRSVKKIRNGGSGRINEVIALKPSVHVRRYTNIISPRPAITANTPSERSSVSYDYDSTFDASLASDVFYSGTRGNVTFTV